uniref:WD repeat-containing protein 27 n=1 Tax=Malurus cyaneus samueli TaxID=2593467 RepID=A0A8C5X9F8_9PASS
MESAGASCASGGRRDPDVVCEKYLFRGKLPELLSQLACSHHLCAFPVNCKDLCIWNTATAQSLYLSGHHYSISALSFGSKIDPLLVCSASPDHLIVWNLDECTEKVQEGFAPRGIVIGTLLRMVRHVRFSPDDQQVAVCSENQIYILSNESMLAELDGHLAPVTAAEFCTWEKSMLVSVSEDRTFKVWDYSTSQLIYQSGIITAFPLLSLLIDEENKQIITGCAEGQLWIFSLISDHNYRCVVHIDLKKEQERFCNKLRKSGKEIGSTVLLECCLPKGSVETSLPILLIEHCDFLRYFSCCFDRFSSLNSRYFWIGTSTGLLIINLANFELEAFLSYRGMFISDYTVLCLITSMFEDMIAVLEVNLAALVRTQHSDFLPRGNEKCLSVIARYGIIKCFFSMLDDGYVIFIIKRSSVLTPCWDGELLVCGLADKTVMIFNSNLTDVHNVFSGHDGAVNSVCWSHDKKWLVSASEDRTLRVWSVCNKEPALILGKETFRKTVRFAQFYYLDTFILLCCGAEFHLLSFHLDTKKDDLKRYKQKSVCKLVQNFSMASAMEITSLSAVNEFYSYIVLTAGSNRALEVFDLNAGCSTAVIQEAHTRSVHQICQNKGSSFSTQQPEAYNLFMTTAAGDGIKLWDLRTLRCERRFEGHSSRCYPCGIAVSPCGRFIASGSDDRYAYIYEMHSSTFLHKLGRHTESVTNVTFSPSSPQGLRPAVITQKLERFKKQLYFKCALSE